MERGILPGRQDIDWYDKEHRERDIILDSIKNRKPMEADKSRGNVVTST